MSKSAMDGAFEKFQQKKYKEAVAAFEKLMADADVPEWQKARITQFKNIAEKALNGPEDSGETGLKDVSFHMNRGEFEEAKAILKDMELPAGGKDYLLAEIAAEEGELDAAVEHLTKAIEDNTANRGYALNSPSIAPHVGKEEFAFLREGAEKN